MKNKYIFEKGSSMPLCAYKNNLYFNYLDGQVIDNVNVFNFIKEGLKRKSMEIKEVDLVIYKIIYITQKGMPIVAYNYLINGCANYLDLNKQPLSNFKRQYLVDKLMDGNYKQKLIWGDEDE